MIYLIGPCKIRRQGHYYYLILKSVATIDPDTGCSEMVKYNNKHAYTMGNIVYKAWLCRHPRPTIITYDCGNEFIGCEFKNGLIKN